MATKYITNEMKSKTRSLLLHGLGFVTGDPTIKIGYPYVFHPGLRVTVSEPGSSKWIYMMLPLECGNLVTDVNIAHHRTGIQSHVSLVRLIEQKEPISATVLYDNKISHSIPSMSVINSACHVIVKNSILLKVCMDFNSTDDIIEFGSVEIRYIPSTVAHEEESVDNTLQSNVKRDISTHRITLRELFFKRKKENIIS